MDFVLVRGPALLDRRLHVRLPRNGTAITVGRAPHCAALLDPSLLFSSQVQCSLFAMPAKASRAVVADRPATPPPLPPADLTDAPSQLRLPHEETPDAGTALHDAVVTPTHQSTQHPPPYHTRTSSVTRRSPGGSGGGGEDTAKRGGGSLPPPFKVYITDLCSSNGTFVNGRRISGTDPTELQHGDVCIFGGMRDVAEGEVLAADAYAGPELVLWRADLAGHQCSENASDGARHEFDFTATPLVLPAPDVLAAEERALMDTVQRSLPKQHQQQQRRPRQDAAPYGGSSATPAAGRPAREALTGSAASHAAAAAGGDADALLFLEEEGSEGRAQRYTTHSTKTELEEGDVDSPRGVQQQLFISPVASPRAAGGDSPRGDEVETEEGEAVESQLTASATLFNDTRAANSRRSVSLVATTPPPSEKPDDLNGVADENAEETRHSAASTPAVPPHAVHYTAVRLGNVSYTAASADAVTDGEGTPLEKRARTEATEAALPLLTCTETHVKWVMPNPNMLWKQQTQQNSADATNLASLAQSKKPFFGMLAITGVATVVACVERRGLAVELKDGCQLPLVDAAVMEGVAESRWVAWRLESSMQPVAVDTDADGTATHASSSGRRVHGGGVKKRGAGRGGRKEDSAVKTRTEGEEGASGVAVLTTPAERFEAWLKHFELFYGRQGVAAPHLVDAATYDLIFAPPVYPASMSE